MVSVVRVEEGDQHAGIADAGLSAGMAGILIAPLAPVTPSAYALFVVPALAAAIVGGFQSPLVAVIAGIAIGMVGYIVYLRMKHDHEIPADPAPPPPPPRWPRRPHARPRWRSSPTR